MTLEEIAALPLELPAEPKGWTQHLITHLNMGRDGHVAAFSIRDQEGRTMPFTFGYCTGKNPNRGFTVIGRDKVLTWRQLRAAWPKVIEWLNEQAQPKAAT